MNTFDQPKNSNEMQFSIDQQEKFTLIKITVERLNAQIAPDLKAELTVLKNENVKNIIFDLSEAKYCDSSGLSAVLVAHRICKDANGSLVLFGLQPPVEKLISISQLDSIFNVVPTFSEALDFIFMEELEKGLMDDTRNDEEEE